MTDVKNRPYVLISCDAHAGADLLDYKPYLEKQFHDEFDAWADSYQEDAWGKLDTEMMDTDDPNLRIGVSSFGSITIGTAGSDSSIWTATESRRR